jgi:single-strand DNA-binding protein
MNKVTLMGRLTADPELKVIKGNKADFTVCSFSLAVQDKYDKEKVDFFRCTAFNKVGEIIDEYFNKGSRILINGVLKNENYERDGKNQTATKVVVEEFYFIENKQGSDKREKQDISPSDFQDDVQSPSNQKSTSNKLDVKEEDFPF